MTTGTPTIKADIRSIILKYQTTGPASSIEALPTKARPQNISLGGHIEEAICKVILQEDLKLTQMRLISIQACLSRVAGPADRIIQAE